MYHLFLSDETVMLKLKASKIIQRTKNKPEAGSCGVTRMFINLIIFFSSKPNFNNNDYENYNDSLMHNIVRYMSKC